MPGEIMEGEEEITPTPEEQPPAPQPLMEQLTGEQPPVGPPVAPAPPPAPPPKKRRKWIALFLVLLVVIVIIAVAASTLPQQATPGDGTEPSWVAVTSLSGLGDKTTDTFGVSGSKFRLTWSATADAECIDLFAPDNCPALFSFFVFPEGETILFVETVSQFDFNSATDETIVFRSGSFYVAVIAANLASWDIQVDEWR